MEESRKNGEKLDPGQLARDGKSSVVMKILDNVLNLTSVYFH